jgi:hypothetical protein
MNHVGRVQRAQSSIRNWNHVCLAYSVAGAAAPVVVSVVVAEVLIFVSAVVVVVVGISVAVFGFNKGCSALGTYPCGACPLAFCTFRSCANMTWTESSTVCNADSLELPQPILLSFDINDNCNNNNHKDRLDRG